MEPQKNKVVSKRHNLLAAEKSPYLLQHAENPVHWYPWGPQAFEKAKQEDKPIFLSIGYSTCHWCHVMAHESFEDEEVAGLMNDTFVSIKVDREERPDIDNFYMMVCQLLTGRGGWPLTILMTPDKEPFFAGTYLPKQNRFNAMGMVELIPRIKKVWKTQREEVAKKATEIIRELQRFSLQDQTVAKKLLEPSILDTAYHQLEERFDEAYGGFGAAPKFPTAHQLLFLLRYSQHKKSAKALHMVEKTLHFMGQGGIYDHVGFGFHRYSVDREWVVPHFEKMLYDQALLTLAFTEAYQVTKNEEYGKIAREILLYVLRDMTAPGGGFYSSEDADSEGEEGKFYLWEFRELDQILTLEETNIIKAFYNVKESGNFVEEATSHPQQKNILYITEETKHLASDSKIEKAKQKIFLARKKRAHPHKDNKILADWNGLMIAAFAKAAQVFEEPRYLEATRAAANFILTKLQGSKGHLLHRYRDGEAAIPAFLDDYAFMVYGLLELYETTFQPVYLQKALELIQEQIKYFWDEQAGGFYFTAKNSENLPVRRKEIYDGAIPSGNSVSLLNLLRIGRMTGNVEFENKANLLIQLFGTQIAQAPMAYTHFLSAFHFSQSSSEVVLVGSLKANETKEMLKTLYQTFLPNKVLLLRPTNLSSVEITRLAPFTKDLSPVGGKTTAYVCANHQCNKPTTNADEMLRSLC